MDLYTGSAAAVGLNGCVCVCARACAGDGVFVVASAAARVERRKGPGANAMRIIPTSAFVSLDLGALDLCGAPKDQR